MKEYIVGGAVRDMLLGNTPTDFDHAFSGDATQFVASHAGAEIVGKSVQVCLWQGQEYMPLRGENIMADLLCRDLTINALALDADNVLYSHPQALHDLHNKILRPASPHALLDDPTRAFRLARFAAHFPDFSLHDEAWAQLRALRGTTKLAALPAERVGRELLKTLTTPRPARFLEVLSAAGLLSPWFAELEGCADIPAGPVQWHQGTVLTHIARVMNETAGDGLAVWMALCHDLGKMLTPHEELPHHYRHEKRGERQALALANRLAMPKLYRQSGALCSRLHMKASMYPRLRIGTCRDLLWATRHEKIHTAFWQVVEADSRQKLRALVARELQIISDVSLPERWRDQGEFSARQFRELQCRALHCHRATTKRQS